MSSGDYILGDVDGVVVVPRDRAVETLANARQIEARESEMKSHIEGATLQRDWIDNLVEVIEVNA